MGEFNPHKPSSHQIVAMAGGLLVAATSVGVAMPTISKGFEKVSNAIGFASDPYSACHTQLYWDPESPQDSRRLRTPGKTVFRFYVSRSSDSYRFAALKVPSRVVAEPSMQDTFIELATPFKQKYEQWDTQIPRPAIAYFDVGDGYTVKATINEHSVSTECLINDSH